MDALFKPVAQVQKVSAGADPKSVLCVFFKQGHCSKGDKCKFSHDLSLENKAEKKSLYVDSRDLEEGEAVVFCAHVLLGGWLVTRNQELGICSACVVPRI